MEDNLEKDAVESTEEEFDIISEPFEEQETDETFYGEELVEEKPTEEVVEESQEESEEETPEETPIKDIPHKEDPSRFEFWQSKFTQEQNARKEEVEELRQELREMKEASSKAPEPEPLKPPEEPESDDPLDKIEYQDKKSKYQDARIKALEDLILKQQEEAKLTQEQAQFKAFAVGKYQEAGADQNESMEAFKFFSSEDSLDFKNQLEMYRAWKGASKPNPKVDQMKARQNKYKAPLPPGVVSGESDVPEEPDFGADLVNFQKTLH